MAEDGVAATAGEVVNNGAVKEEDKPAVDAPKAARVGGAGASETKKRAADDDDEDKPLVSLAKKKPKLDDSDDDVPLGKIAAKQSAPASKPPVKSEKKADSDSDDDVPLGALKKAIPKVEKKPESSSDKKKPPPPKPSKEKKKAKEESSSSEESSSGDDSSSSSSESDSDDEPIAKKKKAATPKASAPKAKSSSSSSAASAAASTSAKSATLKDWLIERLLVRWWYHMEWPPKQRPNVEVEAGYVEMEHYPYMFIHEQTGKVINKRETDETTPPCHKRFNKLSEGELRLICVAAIEAQIKELQEVEPNNTKLVKQLKAEIEDIKHRKKL